MEINQELVIPEMARGPCEAPRHRVDAIGDNAPMAWKPPSSRRSYGENIAPMAWGARNLISTQVPRLHEVTKVTGDRSRYSIFGWLYAPRSSR